MPKILLATDFTEGSRAAEREALELAHKLNASITVLHAYEMPAYSYPTGVFYVPTPELTQELVRGVRESLAATAERIRAGGVAADTRSVEGPAHAEIVRAAEEGQYDLVIMGTHGRSGLKHLWLGSVAEKVVRQCRRPVLTVRAAAAEAEGAAPAA
jgi:nucleotide-binding universal stress UspA family protein